MFWLMGGHAFVAALAAALAGGGIAAAVDYQLNHSDWIGLRYYDLIWPSFMLMVGMAVPLGGTRRSGMARVWRRAAVLFLLGSLRASMAEGTPQWIELSSALQPIAVAYLAAAYLVRFPLRVQGAVAASILAVYGLVLALVPAPGIPAGTLVPNHNLVTFVDMAVIGRAHPEGWGTVLSTLPTISTTLLGSILGCLFAAGTAPRRMAAVIAGAGAACLAAGALCSLWMPPIMKLWTPAYGLLSAGCACLLFLAFYWLVDVGGHRRWAFPLYVIGMNALAAYLGPSIVPVRRIAGIFTKSAAAQAGIFGPVLSTGAALLAAWLVLLWMHRRKIYLRA